MYPNNLGNKVLNALVSSRTQNFAETAKSYTDTARSAVTD